MHQKHLLVSVLVLLASASGLATSLVAQPGDGSVTGWHVVRPGENLEIITNYYLGDPESWRENAALNPGINNPHLIFPGQRIRVLLSRGIPSGSAQVTDLGRQVDQQPTPIDWRTAQQADLLRERDGIRTGTDSSAELRFADGTQVTVSEDSLLFLRGSSTLARPLSRDPQTVEVLVGQADLAASSIDRQQPPVEVWIGETKAKPKPSPEGTLATRARRPDEGGAQVMVYAGESSVEAAGTAVAVIAGMGVSVPDTGPPPAPEPLLSAPELAHPADGLNLDLANPLFSWEPVAGAASYVIDICGDPDCGQLITRETDLTGTSWQIASLSMGDRYWRVAAVDAKGLDGFPSETRSLGIRSDRIERVEPQANVVAVGLHAALGPALVLATDTTLAVEIDDPSGGAAYLEPTLDGEAVSMEEVASGWDLGRHVLGGTLVSAQGERAEIESVPFIYDTAEPVIDWQVGTVDTLTSLHGLDQDEKPKKPKRKIKTHRDVPVLWSVDGIIWLPVLPENQNSAEWEIQCDEPQFFFWTREDDPFGSAPSLSMREGELMRVEASDEHSAIGKLILRATRSGSGYEVSLEARDLVDNSATRTWGIENR